MKKNLAPKLMVQTGILAGITFNTGLLWGLDNNLDIIVPFVFFSAIIFVAINLLFHKPTQAPPKC